MDGKLLLIAGIVFIAALDGIKGHLPPCGSQQFRCFDGQCIPRQFYCDRKEDCGDNSDERLCYYKGFGGHCPQREISFNCFSRDRCIPNEWKCDGQRDCPDGSDELGCLQTTTPPTVTGKNPCTPNPCQNKGKCQISNGKATCLCEEPFIGRNCTIDRCDPNPCQNEGKCQVSNEKVTCVCQDPFTGPYCTINRCDPNPCQYKGECKVTEGELTCLCKDPYTGPNCTVGEDPCTPDPCQNKGKCQILNGKVTCLCEEPFTGPNCTINRCDPNPCQNEGKCEVSKEKVACVCQNPFTGPNCTINRCDPNPCQNKGKCQVSNEKVTCVCQDPFTGPNCTINRCDPNPCQNKGKCQVSNEKVTCVCQDPFTGPNCTINRCDPNPCQNKGKCQVSNEKVTCVCQDPFTGPNCTINRCDPNPCQNKGKCQVSNEKVTCVCQDPFTGPNCTINRCDPNPCQNKGKCQVSNEKVTCVCQDPFTGPNCTINRCDPNPCQYKGECKLTEGELTCLCKDPYTGPNCTEVSLPEKNISSITGVDTTTDNMIRSLKAKKDNSRSIAKWGPELPRIAATLFLSDPQIFAPGNATGAELACELSLQMIAKLALKKKITTQKLALFMNALAVSCIDLKDFFGVNLVAELRKRVNNGDYTNPFTYLTLCSVGDTMTPTDVTIVASTFEARRRPLWTDVQALATMAMTCMNSRDDSLVNDETLSNMVKELKERQHANGTVVSLRTTALVMQALIATNSYRVDFDFAGAVKYLVREAANRSLSVQEMYYILPVLKSVSFVNVSSNHCSAPIKTELQVLQTLRESVEDRIPVRVSMFLGNEVDFSRNWQLKVPASYNFYQVLENIGTLEPTYKVRYSIGQDKKPYIVGIHKYFDNAEDQMFWFIFSQKLRNATRPTLVDKSPVDIQLKEDEELILWYRSGTWIDSS